MEQRPGMENISASWGIICFSLQDGYPVLFCNPFFGALFPEKQTLLDCVEPCDREQVLQALQTITETSGGDIFFHASAAGQKIFCLLRVTLEKQEPSIAHGLLLDITQYRDEVQRLKRQANQYRDAICADCVANFDVDLHENRIEYSNCLWDTTQQVQAYDAFIKTMCAHAVSQEDTTAFLSCFDRENVLNAAHKGVRVIQHEYRAAWPEQVWMRCTMNLLYRQKQNLLYGYARVCNIDAQKRSEILLRRVADCDELTGVLNRRAFQKQVDELLHHCMTDNRRHMLIMIDLDNFKQINDTCGHARGDETLISFALSLRMGFRKQDLIARLGGDEFAVFMCDIVEPQNATQRAQKICRGIMAGCSAGGAIAPRDGQTFDELYRKADVALYQSKNAGKGIVKIYDRNMEES